MNTVLKRSQIPTEDTWNLERVYANDTLWQQDYEEIMDLIKAYAGNQGRLTQDTEVVKSILDQYYTISRRAGKLYVYATQRRRPGHGQQHLSGYGAEGVCSYGTV